MDSGKPQKQALAIAYNVMKKNRKKMAAGGAVDNEDLDPEHDVGLSAEPPEGETMSKGGIAVHPMHMAHLIMAKKMASGGMADDCYAEGGEVDDSDFDNSDSESASLPFDDEDAVGIPPLGYDSPREDIEGMHEQAEDPKMKRKKMLSGIMRNLHTGK